MEKSIKLFDVIDTRAPITLTKDQTNIFKTPEGEYALKMLAAYGRLECLGGDLRVYPQDPCTLTPDLSFRFDSVRDNEWGQKVIAQIRIDNPSAITKQVTTNTVKLFEDNLEGLNEILHDFSLIVDAVKAVSAPADTFKLMVFDREDAVLITNPISADEIANQFDIALEDWAMNECMGKVARGNLKFTIIQAQDAAPKGGQVLNQETVAALTKSGLVDRTDLVMAVLAGNLEKVSDTEFRLHPKSELEEPVRLQCEVHCDREFASTAMTRLSQIPGATDILTAQPTDYGIGLVIDESGLRKIAEMVRSDSSKITELLDQLWIAEADIPHGEIEVCEISYDTGGEVLVWEGKVSDTFISTTMAKLVESEKRFFINRLSIKIRYK